MPLCEFLSYRIHMYKLFFSHVTRYLVLVFSFFLRTKYMRLNTTKYGNIRGSYVLEAKNLKWYRSVNI
jgi:hypothetical protein